MIIALIIISTILSTILYSKLSFRKELSFLSTSYKKTLTFTTHQDSDTSQIKESLAQMRVLFTVFSKLIIILLPFLIIALFLFWNNSNIKSEIFNLQNNLIILFTFFITKSLLSNGN